MLWMLRSCGPNQFHTQPADFTFTEGRKQQSVFPLIVTVPPSVKPLNASGEMSAGLLRALANGVSPSSNLPSLCQGMNAQVQSTSLPYAVCVAFPAGQYAHDGADKTEQNACIGPKPDPRRTSAEAEECVSFYARKVATKNTDIMQHLPSS